MIVTNKEDVAAFANFKPESKAAGKPAAAKVEQAAKPVAPAVPVVEAAVPVPPPAPPKPQAEAAKPSGGRVFATPLARKFAAERNIDISVWLTLLFRH